MKTFKCCCRPICNFHLTLHADKKLRGLSPNPFRILFRTGNGEPRVGWALSFQNTIEMSIGIAKILEGKLDMIEVFNGLDSLVAQKTGKYIGKSWKICVDLKIVRNGDTLSVITLNPVTARRFVCSLISGPYEKPQDGLPAGSDPDMFSKFYQEEVL